MNRTTPAAGLPRAAELPLKSRSPAQSTGRPSTAIANAPATTLKRSTSKTGRSGLRQCSETVLRASIAPVAQEIRADLLVTGPRSPVRSRRAIRSLSSRGWIGKAHVGLRRHPHLYSTTLLRVSYLLHRRLSQPLGTHSKAGRPWRVHPQGTTVTWTFISTTQLRRQSFQSALLHSTRYPLRQTQRDRGSRRQCIITIAQSLSFPDPMTTPQRTAMYNRVSPSLVAILHAPCTLAP